MENTLTDSRRSLARIVMLVLLAELVLRIMQVAIRGAIIPLPTYAPSTAPVTSQPTFVRLEWLSQCDPARQGLALYTVGNDPCRPVQIASLTWLQSQLTTKGLLASTEYLEWAADPTNTACQAVVLAGPNSAPNGRVCADWRGIYRANLAGQDFGKRLQLWSDGNWVQSQ
ncbi:MAG: hypothetical protein HYZ49_12460 [Chloroflexi bacterium]|nr:hypothetical protein [Chloroflexota bacterium]